MAKTIVGLFDDFSEAQMVAQDLINSGFRREDISVVANQDAVGRERMVGDEAVDSSAAEGAGAGAVGGTVLGGALGFLVGAGLLAIPGIGPVLAAGPLAAAIGSTAATVGATALGAGIGAATGGLIGGLIGSGVPREDAEYYAEGVRRGGTLVSVNADDTMADLAHDIMLRHNVVDIEDRATEWRSSGWAGFDDSTQPRMDAGTMGTTGTMAADRTVHSDDIRSDVGTTRGDETVLPVVEEEIDINKRRVDKGGVRVTSRVEERPVEEQVNLREERVNVERRPVDRPVTDADSAFKEASFEVRESYEEPVVRKRARVVEEVVVDTDVRDRTETIRDTVRRTDVDVQQTGGTMDTGVTGEMRDFDAYDNDYRSHYQTAYGSAGYTYDDYAPVYRYGHSLATDQRYSGRDWTDIEMDARRRWEERNPGTWEQFKDTVRFAWDKARGRR